MNHMAGYHLACGCHDRFSGRQPTGVFRSSDLFAFLQDLRSAGAMDCAIDASATEQRVIGGINDRIDVFSGDIADFDYDPAV